MKSIYYKFLKSPVFDDLEKNRIANLMNLILLFNGIFIMLLLFGFIIFGLSELRNIIPIIAALIMYVIFYIMLRRGIINFTATLFVIVSYVVNTVVIILYGGIQGPQLFLYFVTIVIASAVLREVYSIAIYALIMLSAIAMYLFEKSGILEPFYITDIEIAPLIILGTNLIIMVGIIYLSNRSFRQALVLYEDELKTRRKAENKIKQLNLKLEQRVKERTAELEEVNKELESFSYSISHDLRAPLRTISGFSNILLENNEKNLNEESMEYLKKIRNTTKKMSSMINGLLDLSRITIKNIQTSTVNLSKMALEITNDLHPNEWKRKVEFNIANDVKVQGDERLLRILLSNLIDNSWKFTKNQKKAFIEFSIIEENGTHIFYIKDNGVGFEKTYAHKLFNPFQRLHSEHEFEGLGIGLATCKKIVQRHGGKLWAESEVGKGTTFYFTLPSENNN